MRNGWWAAALGGAVVAGACASEESEPAAVGGTGGAGASTTSSSTGGNGGATTSSTTTSNTGLAGGGGQGGMPLEPCDPIPNASYGTLVTVGPPNTDPAPLAHPDLNVKVRGWSATDAALELVDYGGDTDTLAPKLYSMFSDDHVPTFVHAYRVNGWDWGNMVPTGPITDWDVTMIAFASADGEIIELPRSGYDIGGGFGARVLLVDDDSMTLKYTGEDNVVSGYTIHLVGICPEPSLKALYESCDGAGRTELPALTGDQPLGRSRGASFMVAIRDTGSFMDPRSQKDWW